jgi:hypothetical protein
MEMIGGLKLSGLPGLGGCTLEVIDISNPEACDRLYRQKFADDHDPRLKTVEKPANCPKVGDTVTLNNHGLIQVFGTTIGLSAMKRLEMKITYVDDLSMTFPEPTFVVEVDNEEINTFLIDHHCFDIVRKA